MFTRERDGNNREILKAGGMFSSIDLKHNCKEQ